MFLDLDLAKNKPLKITVTWTPVSVLWGQCLFGHWQKRLATFPLSWNLETVSPSILIFYFFPTLGIDELIPEGNRSNEKEPLKVPPIN